jgi:hypothetical protein
MARNKTQTDRTLNPNDLQTDEDCEALARQDWQQANEDERREWSEERYIASRLANYKYRLLPQLQRRRAANASEQPAPAAEQPPTDMER